MKISLITESTFPPFNRANLRLYRLAKNLVKHGNNVYFISPSKFPWSRENGDYENIKICQYFGFGQYLYSNFRAVIRAYHLIATILTVIWLNLRKKIDVIHAWNPLAGFAAVLSGKIIKKPVFIDFTDFYSDIALTDSNKFIFFILKKIEFFILKNAAKVIVVSEIMKKRLIEKGIEERKIFIVEDGADKDWFNPSMDGLKIRRRIKLPPNEFIIVYHGDIKQPDGVDILFKAFKKVLRETADAKLIILGGKGSKYFEDIKKLGKDLEIDNSIFYTGWVERQEVPEYLAAADVGAMPMRATLNHQCYLSFKLFEYWASGKPVVTTKLDAISQIVKNGENGLIVNPENIEELAQAFIYLLKNPEKAKEMGRNGRKLIEEKFDWDLLMEKEVKLYESINN